MKTKKTIPSICLLILASSFQLDSVSAQQPTAGRGARAAQGRSRGAKSEAQLKAELETLLTLPVGERIAPLRALIEANPRSLLRVRATEQLVSAHAAVGDQKLQANDAAGGIEMFTQAVALAPADMSDKLYFEVVAQLPSNLFLRGQAAAAITLARAVESKSDGSARRLLAVAAFYLSVEQADEATRVAQAASKLAPDLAAAHQALGAVHRLALRLDAAAAEYARAVELDPRSVAARHSLADLRRATGKPEEALAIYRALLATDPADRAARTGVVLALFDAGRRAEADSELETLLKEEPRNLPLLVGAAYWYAGPQGEARRALDLAGQAVRIEPRYTWAQIALGRALIGNKLPLEAERSLRFARQYGRFPTLDYELANALAAAGLYNEAFEELARSFKLTDGQLETQLAGHTPARAATFIELVAPERRAGIFQPVAADTEANARMLKGLLALHLALNIETDGATVNTQSAGATATVNESAVIAAANDFTAGTDEMRAFRQLYAANRMLARGVAWASVLELMNGARGGVEAAMNSPAATVATTADEIRSARAAAIAQGGTPDVPTLPQTAVSNILRGRIEEMTGMALLGQGKTAEAAASLRRAVSVLPERSLYWRTAQWRLGTALASGGNERDALAAYLKSYNREQPDPARRAVIESLYAKLNGSLNGLDAEIGIAPAAARTASMETATSANPATQSSVATNASPANMSQTATATPAQVETPAPAVAPANSTPAPVAVSVPDATPVTTDATANGTPEPSPSTISAMPSPEATPAATPDAATSAPVNTSPFEVKSAPTPEPAPRSTPEPSADTAAGAAARPVQDSGDGATATASSARANKRGESKRDERKNGCTLVLSASEIALGAGGGSASINASLEGGSGNLAGISAATPNWSDIIILREPQGNADTSSLKFTITSISKTTGNFILTFKSPCGAQDVAVTVK